MRLENQAFPGFGSPARNKSARRFLTALVAAAGLWLPPSRGAANPEEAGELSQLSLEELMGLEVTTASRKEQRLSDVASAVYVLTADEIRRSGARSLVEALRGIPGLAVAAIDANKWAVSARGFNGRFANKMLVLIDGRSVYTPLFSGVFWDVQDMLLEDLERIEVIRGPGATLWGANAVNGVINVITKRSSATQGWLLGAGTGSEERASGAVRYGGKLRERGHYRAYMKGFDRDARVDAGGAKAADKWRAGRGGFRVDAELSPRDRVAVTGDAYSGSMGGNVLRADPGSPLFSRNVEEHGRSAGLNLLGRWERSLEPERELAFQLYYDRTYRRDALHRETRDSFDFDSQLRFKPMARHEVILGAGYRATRDELEERPGLTLRERSRTDSLFSAFVQDEIKLARERVRLTLGSKFEHNDYTGFEIQPSLRLLYKPSERHTLWSAVSRAVRTPSRAEDGIQFDLAAFPNPDSSVSLVRVQGRGDFTAEELLALELGYRVLPVSRVSLDVAAYYNDYNQLRSAEPGRPGLDPALGPGVVVLPLVFANQLSGETAGAELSLTWSVSDRLKLRGGYSHFRIWVRPGPRSLDTSSFDQEHSDPRHQLQLRSYLDLPGAWELDASLFHVSELVAQEAPAYTRVDARVGWHPSSALGLGLSLTNLLDDRHREFGSVLGEVPTEVERGIHGQVLWRF